MTASPEDLTGQPSSDDVVCRLARGEIEAAVVWRTTTLIAFLDHRPVFKGHVLVCPIHHVPTLPDLSPGAVTDLFLLTQRVAACLPDALGVEGSFTAINTVVSQSVPHVHVHVVPRSKGDGLRGFFWPRTRYADGEAAQYAGRIAAALAAREAAPEG